MKVKTFYFFLSGVPRSGLTAGRKESSSLPLHPTHLMLWRQINARQALGFIVTGVYNGRFIFGIVLR